MDTHTDNGIMQSLLEKLGFKRCGIIYVVEDNYPRYNMPILLLGLVQMCGDADDEEDDVARYYIPDDVREMMSECSL